MVSWRDLSIKAKIFASYTMEILAYLGVGVFCIVELANINGKAAERALAQRGPDRSGHAAERGHVRAGDGGERVAGAGKRPARRTDFAIQDSPHAGGGASPARAERPGAV